MITGASERRMGPQMEPWGTMVVKGQEGEEEPTKKTESQQTETEECGVTDVPGGKVSTGPNADEKSNKLKTEIYPQGL